MKKLLIILIVGIVFTGACKPQKVIESNKTSFEYVIIKGNKVFYKDYPDIDLNELKRQSVTGLKRKKENKGFIQSVDQAIQELINPSNPQMVQIQITHSDHVFFGFECGEAQDGIPYFPTAPKRDLILCCLVQEFGEEMSGSAIRNSPKR